MRYHLTDSPTRQIDVFDGIIGVTIDATTFFAETVEIDTIVVALVTWAALPAFIAELNPAEPFMLRDDDGDQLLLTPSEQSRLRSHLTTLLERRGA